MEVFDVHDTMAITESDTQTTDTPTESTHTVDLRELGRDGPLSCDHSPTPLCSVTIVGDVESTAEVRLELAGTTWVVAVALRTGELESVYDDAGPVPKPETVPDWVAAVCDAVGIDEVSV